MVMTEKSVLCPRCGIGLVSGGDVRGLCPTCMLEFAFGEDPSETRAKADVARSAIAEDPMIGSRFGTYEIEAVLGRGGMGVVYRARHTTLGRTVAIKMLPEDLARDSAFTVRFQREARALASLAHPNIVSVHDFGCIDGRYYFAMEHVDGPSLRELLRHKRISATRALEIVPQLCDALQYAHRQGVVHRDIKPENILVDAAGNVKIADFGLAKIVGADITEYRELTRSNMVMGTLHYMAPEQVERPKEVDHRADIYSLGVVYYEMLTGELPLGRFDPPSRRAQVSPSLDDVVLKTLEKQPERRYQQVSEVKTDTERISRLPGGGLTDARPAAAEATAGAGVALGARDPWLPPVSAGREAAYAATALGGVRGDKLAPRPTRVLAAGAGFGVAAAMAVLVLMAKSGAPMLGLVIVLGIALPFLGLLYYGAREWSRGRWQRGLASIGGGLVALLALPCLFFAKATEVAQPGGQLNLVVDPLKGKIERMEYSAVPVESPSQPVATSRSTELSAVNAAIDAQRMAAERAARGAQLREVMLHWEDVRLRLAECSAKYTDAHPAYVTALRAWNDAEARLAELEGRPVRAWVPIQPTGVPAERPVDSAGAEKK